MKREERELVNGLLRTAKSAVLLLSNLTAQGQIAGYGFVKQHGIFLDTDSSSSNGCKKIYNQKITPM